MNYPTNARLVPSDISFTTKTQATSFTSPFTGQEQTVRYSGQWWECTLSYPPLFQTDAETLTAFINSLNGTAGTFYWKPPSPYLMSGSLTATMASTSNTFAETNGQTGKFGIEQASGRLIQFTGTSSLFPILPAGAHSIGTTNGANFKLMSNEQTFTINTMRLYGCALAIKEAI